MVYASMRLQDIHVSVTKAITLSTKFALILMSALRINTLVGWGSASTRQAPMTAFAQRDSFSKIEYAKILTSVKTTTAFVDPMVIALI